VARGVSEGESKLSFIQHYPTVQITMVTIKHKHRMFASKNAMQQPALPFLSSWEKLLTERDRSRVPDRKAYRAGTKPTTCCTPTSQYGIHMLITDMATLREFGDALQHKDSEKIIRIMEEISDHFEGQDIESLLETGIIFDVINGSQISQTQVILRRCVSKVPARNRFLFLQSAVTTTSAPPQDTFLLTLLTDAFIDLHPTSRKPLVFLKDLLLTFINWHHNYTSSTSTSPPPPGSPSPSPSPRQSALLCLDRLLPLKWSNERIQWKAVKSIMHVVFSIIATDTIYIYPSSFSNDSLALLSSFSSSMDNLERQIPAIHNFLVNHYDTIGIESEDEDENENNSVIYDHSIILIGHALYVCRHITKGYRFTQLLESSHLLLQYAAQNNDTSSLALCALDAFVYRRSSDDEDSVPLSTTAITFTRDEIKTIIVTCLLPTIAYNQSEVVIQRAHQVFNQILDNYSSELQSKRLDVMDEMLSVVEVPAQRAVIYQRWQKELGLLLLSIKQKTNEINTRSVVIDDARKEVEKRALKLVLNCLQDWQHSEEEELVHSLCTPFADEAAAALNILRFLLIQNQGQLDCYDDYDEDVDKFLKVALAVRQMQTSVDRLLTQQEITGRDGMVGMALARLSEVISRVQELLLVT